MPVSDIRLRTTFWFGSLKNEQTSVEQSVTFYSVQEIKALEEKQVECLNKRNLILLLQ